MSTSAISFTKASAGVELNKKLFFVFVFITTPAVWSGTVFFHFFSLFHCNNVALAVLRFPVGSVVISQRNDFSFFSGRRTRFSAIGHSLAHVFLLFRDSEELYD